jgi:endoglucanase Acf2
MYEFNNKRRKVMLLVKVINKLATQIILGNKPADVTETIAKMDLAIARIQQNQQVYLLRTDYLE